MFVGVTLVCLTDTDLFSRSSLLGSCVLFNSKWNISITKSQKVRAGMPFMRQPASREMDFTVLYVSESCFKIQKQSNPINQVRVYHPSSILHRSVLFHIQLFGTNVWLAKTHNVLELDFESPKSPEKIGVLKQSQSALLGNITHIRILFACTCVMDARINGFNRLSQALVHFVINRANLIADHNISGRPILAKYKHFRTISEHTFDNPPTDFNSSFWKWWSSTYEVNIL